MIKETLFYPAPGEDLQIVDQQVLINGQPVLSPSEAEFTYAVLFDPMVGRPENVLASLGFRSGFPYPYCYALFFIYNVCNIQLE